MCVCVSGGGEPEHVIVNIVNHEIWPPQCDCRVCKKKPSAPIHMSIRKSCVTHTCVYTRFSTCSRDPGFLFFFLRSFSLRAEMLPTRHRSHALAWPMPACAPSGWTLPGSQPSTVCLVACTRHACPVPSCPVHPIQPSGRPPRLPNGPVSCLRSLPHRLSLPISSITLCGLHIYTSALFCLQKRFHYITKNNQ